MLNKSVKIKNEGNQIKKVKVSVPGSCGELFQGKIGNDRLLISCPIAKYSNVRAELKNNYEGVRANKDLPKSLLAVEILLDKLMERKIGIELKFSSELLVGKGMGSSTADIAATLAAVMILINDRIDWKLLKDILLKIEPTDSTIWPGLTLFDYRVGEIFHPLGNPPSFDILIFTEVGQIDTVKFNKKLDSANTKKYDQENELKKAIELIKIGIKNKSPEKLAAASIISAKAHQKIYYRPHLDYLLELIEDWPGVYGLNIAHSGTLFGLLVDEKRTFSNLTKKINTELANVNYLYRTKIISGGIKIERKE